MTLARLLKPNLRKDAKGENLFKTAVTVFIPPVFRALWAHEQIETAAIGQLVGSGLSNCGLNCSDGKLFLLRHDLNPGWGYLTALPMSYPLSYPHIRRIKKDVAGLPRTNNS